MLDPSAVADCDRGLSRCMPFPGRFATVGSRPVDYVSEARVVEVCQEDAACIANHESIIEVVKHSLARTQNRYPPLDLE